MSAVIHSVIIAEKALSVIESEVCAFGIIETGGILMGHLHNGIIYIDKASDAGPHAIHDQFYFRADPNYIDMFIDMESANSSGKNHYLGEWHTHPQLKPEPSEVDLNSLSEIASTSQEFAILLIVGAIKFSKENLLNQQVLILKYKDDRSFFQLKKIAEGT